MRAERQRWSHLRTGACLLLLPVELVILVVNAVLWEAWSKQ